MDGTTEFLIQLGTLITVLGTMTAIISKRVSKDIKNMDYNNCKTYLTDFLSDVKSGIKKSPIQIQRACEIYTHYTKELQGNTYIQTEWEKLMK